jgi:seryl-tRNA synthetase
VPGGEPLGPLDRLPLALVTHRAGAVHLVRVCAAQDAPAQLAILVRHTTQCLSRLGLAYRVVRRPAAALEFAARATDGIEVWLPARRRYQPICACTDSGAFLARRGGIRVRGGGEPYPATLHAAALPIEPAVRAIAEQYRDPGGAVRIPDVLLPYTASAG